MWRPEKGRARRKVEARVAREKKRPEKRRGQRKEEAREKKRPEKRRGQRKEEAREKKRPEKRRAKREIPTGQGGNAVDPERPPKSVVIGDYFWLRARLRSATAFGGCPFPGLIFM